MIPIHRIAFEIVSHRVSASSWSDSRSFTSSQWPLLTITDRLPFLNPVPMTRVLSGRSCCLPKFQKDSDRKSQIYLVLRIRNKLPPLFRHRSRWSMDLDLQRSAQGTSACMFSCFYRYISVLFEDDVNFFAVGKLMA